MVFKITVLNTYITKNSTYSTLDVYTALIEDSTYSTSLLDVSKGDLEDDTVFIIVSRIV